MGCVQNVEVDQSIVAPRLDRVFTHPANASTHNCTMKDNRGLNGPKKLVGSRWVGQVGFCTAHTDWVSPKHL
jgi:hypothetical protein